MPVALDSTGEVSQDQLETMTHPEFQRASLPMHGVMKQSGCDVFVYDAPICSLVDIIYARKLDARELV